MIRILLGESDVSTREMLALALKHSGLEVTVAATGLAVLEHARAARPDLILANVQLAELGGCDVCKVVRADQQLVGIKVVLYGSPDETDVDWRCAGAECFLQKPVNVRRIAEFLVRLVGVEPTGSVSQVLEIGVTAE